MAVSEPVSLGLRGSEVWRGLSEGVTDPARLALVTEAARLADRLDELDNIIQGKGVLNLMQFRLDFPSEDGKPFTVEVKFQNVLAEARQQALAFGTLLKTLGLDAATAAPAVAAPKTGKDMLEQKRAERAKRSS